MLTPEILNISRDESRIRLNLIYKNSVELLASVGDEIPCSLARRGGRRARSAGHGSRRVRRGVPPPLRRGVIWARAPEILQHHVPPAHPAKRHVDGRRHAHGRVYSYRHLNRRA